MGKTPSRFTLENPPEAAKALSQWDAKLGKTGLLFRGVVAKLKHAQAIYGPSPRRPATLNKRRKPGSARSRAATDSIAHPLDSRPDVVTRRATVHSFWTGESKPKTAISHWQCELKRLFELAKVENGHAQRFRDTVATGLLLQGLSLAGC